MAFSVTDDYIVYTPGVGIGQPAVVEQAGEFYAVRLLPPTDPAQTTYGADSLGPYATREDAATHLSELPPAPPEPPPAPPFIPPGMVPEST
jgi:hypothetical protein